MDMVAGATQQSSQSIEDAAKRAREMATLQEKLNILFAQMIPILTPVIDLLTDMAGFFADNATAIKWLTGLLLGAAGTAGLVAAGSAIGSAFGPAGTVIGALVGGVAALTLGFALLADSINLGGDNASMLGDLFEGFIYPFRAVITVIQSLLKFLEPVTDHNNFY